MRYHIANTHPDLSVNNSNNENDILKVFDTIVLQPLALKNPDKSSDISDLL